MEMKKLTPEWLANKIIFNDTSDESLTRASKIQITKVEMNDSEGTLIVRADFYTGIHTYPHIQFSLKTACLLEKFKKEPFEIEADGFTYVGIFNGTKYEYSML